MHFRLLVEYDGTEFQGWQVQPEQRTVQGTLETALARLLHHPVRIAAAGRTDAGVHAAGQVVCFRTTRELPADTIERALNALTPRDLAIRAVDIVAEDFDARRSARSRVYRYRLWTRQMASPFWGRYAWHVRRPLNLEGMAAAAQVLVGEHDFSSFRGAGCAARHPVRIVRRSELWHDGDVLSYEIEANGFLRHMVRNIIGTLVEIGVGQRDPTEMTWLLEARARTLAGATAPPHGLCLMQVSYEGAAA